MRIRLTSSQDMVSLYLKRIPRKRDAECSHKGKTRSGKARIQSQSQRKHKSYKSASWSFRKLSDNPVDVSNLKVLTNDATLQGCCCCASLGRHRGWSQDPTWPPCAGGQHGRVTEDDECAGKLGWRIGQWDAQVPSVVQTHDQVLPNGSSLWV